MLGNHDKWKQCDLKSAPKYLTNLYLLQMDGLNLRLKKKNLCESVPIIRYMIFCKIGQLDFTKSADLIWLLATSVYSSRLQIEVKITECVPVSAPIVSFLSVKLSPRWFKVLYYYTRYIDKSLWICIKGLYLAGVNCHF